MAAQQATAATVMDGAAIVITAGVAVAPYKVVKENTVDVLMGRWHKQLGWEW